MWKSYEENVYTENMNINLKHVGKAEKKLN